MHSSAGADRVELERFADEWAAAIVANDADSIAEFMSEDWVMVSETGVSGRDQFLVLVGSGRLTHSAMERVAPLQIRRLGDEVALTSRVTNTAHLDGQRFDADEWTTDILVRSHDRWKCVLTQVTPASDQTPPRPPH